jgi:lipopolysaccharide transport system ATP-binding protein
MSSRDSAVFVSNLSKCYHIYPSPRDRLKQFVIPRLIRFISAFKSTSQIAKAQKQFFFEFWALRDISFEVKSGETVGIVGRNGSGKSTLLQMICGTLTPSAGQILTKGRVAALLELGSGFNPEFSGRDNVFLNAAVLGLTKEEIEARYETIVSFAEIGEFIDRPVKTYSSGMMVRLAFSVIAHVDADILVVDEALSVGDVFFSQKCMRFFEQFKAEGGTVLFVSHDTSAIMKLCDRAILLVSGSIVKVGTAEVVCKAYLEQLYADRSLEQVVDAKDSSLETRLVSAVTDRVDRVFTVDEQRPNSIFVSAFNLNSASLGLGGATILDAGYFDENGARIVQFESGSRVTFTIVIKSAKLIRFPAIGLVIKDRLGQAVFTESTTWAFEGQYGDEKLAFLPSDTVSVNFHHVVPILFEGEYSVTVAVAEGFGHEHVQHHLIHEALVLRVAGRRIVHGLSGFAGLSTSIKITRGVSEFELNTTPME